MANGDKAAAKGWATVPATKAHSTGQDDINRAMDYTAQEIDDRTAADTAIRTDMGVTKIIVSSTTPAVVNGALWIRPVT